MIQIQHLMKTFSSPQGNVAALDDVSLHIPEGAIYGIIGLSGAGKSTLVRCLNLLEKPTGGQVVVTGQDLTKLSGKELRKTRQKIGMIFQHFHLLQARTVAENIAFPLEIAQVPGQEISLRVAELLHLVGLKDKAQAYPGQLSGGQKQRVGIARALATKPQVLLCDEATSALDPQTTLAILNLLRDINRKLGLTIVMITHEMKVVKEICSHVAVLHQGRIVENGPVETVFIQPRSEIARQFISTIFAKTLSPDLLREFAAHPDSEIVRLQFFGAQASEPIISDLLSRCGVQASILNGNIDHLKSILFGNLTLELQGNTEQLRLVHAYFASRQINVEVIQSAL